MFFLVAPLPENGGEKLHLCIKDLGAPNFSRNGSDGKRAQEKIDIDGRAEQIGED